MRVCVVFNPAAKGNRARHFRQHMDGLGADCTLKPTAAPGAGRQLAAEAVREGFDTIVAAGGDGTLNEVLNGIDSVAHGLDHVRLGLLPLGTVNVFARELGLPLAVERAWAVIRSGRERILDLAVAEFGPPGNRQRRCFAQLGGAGLDARAVELVNWGLKKKIGPLAYVVAALRAMREPQVPVTVQAASETLTGELVLVGNGRFYGGRFVVFPGAKATDGLLDVCVLPKLTWWTVVRCGAGLLGGRVDRHLGARHLQAECVTLSAPRRVPLQLDGESVGELPATFTVRRMALRVLVP